MNTKTLFYSAHRHLARQRKHLARVLMGPACEGWLNAEICVATNGSYLHRRRSGEFAYGESKKRDIAIFTGSEGSVSHVVEVKVVYPYSDHAILQGKLLALRRQLERKRYDDETESTRMSGFIFGVWSSWYEPETDKAFRARLRELIHQALPPKQYTTQHQHRLETILVPTTTILGSTSWRVAMSGMYVTLRA